MRAIFWVSFALVAYAYLGYPAWLWFRSWWSPRPVRRGLIEPSVSVILVARNEERAMPAKLDNLLSLDYPRQKLEIVAVSDGSTDNTDAILRQAAKDSRIRVLLRPSSSGKAAGLNEAVRVASGEILLLTDTRQKIESGALRFLIENFADPEVGCASGELMLGNSEDGETGKGMGLYWRIEKKIREMESAFGSVVGATGAIYCARRGAFEPLPPGTILDDVLVPMQAVRRGSRVVFDSRARAWDSPDLGAAREFSRKERTLTGNYQLLQLAPWLLSSNNPARFQFVSHKLSRLVVPFALIGMLIASLLASGSFYRAALLAQLVFYSFGLIAISGLRIGPLSRVADAARTFVVLNSAAAVAFVNFVSGRKAVWAR